MDKPEKPLVLRTKMSLVIAFMVWLVLAYLLFDAVLKLGAASLWQYGPLILLIAVLNWVFMYAPNMKITHNAVEINNIFHSYQADFAAIEKVNIAAMVSILARTETGTKRITAWNAPGIKKDNFSDRLSSHDGIVASSKPRSGGIKSAPNLRLSSEARFDRDQRLSPSYVLYERWRSSETKTNNPQTLQVRMNWLGISLLLVATALLGLRIIL